MKKILIIFIILSFYGCSGYKPILTSKSINFNIKQIEINKDDKISYVIKKKLNPYTKQPKEKINILLRIDSTEQINVIAKDSKGDDSVYEITIKTNDQIVFEDLNKEQIKFQEKFNFNNQSNKFALEQYKKDIRSDLIKKIVEKLILKLRVI